MHVSFQDRELARKLLKEGKKDRAKLLLRKKKYQEGLLDQTAGQLDNIERLCQDLEFTQVLLPRSVVFFIHLLSGSKASAGWTAKELMPAYLFFLQAREI